MSQGLLCKYVQTYSWDKCISGECLRDIKILRDIDTSHGHKISQKHQNIDPGGASNRGMDLQMEMVRETKNI